MHRKLIMLALLLLPFSVSAAEKPTELSGVIRAEKPVGTAQMRALFLDVYRISFWSDSGSWQTAPYALSITYDMGFSADELADRTYVEMQKVSDLPPAQLKAYSDNLRTIYPAIRKGERVTALRIKSGTVFYHNGKRIGKISAPSFADAFFSIWLSPKSSEPDMQQQLLPSSN
jgi:hypothetical protein